MPQLITFVFEEINFREIYFYTFYSFAVQAYCLTLKSMWGSVKWDHERNCIFSIFNSWWMYCWYFDCKSNDLKACWPKKRPKFINKIIDLIKVKGDVIYCLEGLVWLSLSHKKSRKVLLLSKILPASFVWCKLALTHQCMDSVFLIND